MSVVDKRKVTIGRIIQILQEKGWRPPNLADHAADAILEDIQARTDYEGMTDRRHGNQQGLFTNQQLYILELAGQGKDVAEIAEELSLSTKTVQYHRSALLKRSGCNSIAHAVAVALAEGLIAAPEIPKVSRNGDHADGK